MEYAGASSKEGGSPGKARMRSWLEQPRVSWVAEGRSDCPKPQAHCSSRAIGGNNAVTPQCRNAALSALAAFKRMLSKVVRVLMGSIAKCIVIPLPAPGAWNQ